MKQRNWNSHSVEVRSRTKRSEGRKNRTPMPWNFRSKRKYDGFIQELAPRHCTIYNEVGHKPFMRFLTSIMKVAKSNNVPKTR